MVPNERCNLDGSIVVSEDIIAINAIKYTDGTIVVAFMDGIATVKLIWPGDTALPFTRYDRTSHTCLLSFRKTRNFVIIEKVIWHMNPEDIAEMLLKREEAE